MQIEDAIFVDENRMVTLESIFYQKDSKYSKISKNEDLKENIMSFGYKQNQQTVFNDKPEYFQEAEIPKFKKF